MTNNFYPLDFSKELISESQLVSKKAFKIQEAFISYSWVNECADEYAKHGFSRRLATIAKCIENVFDTLPPNYDGIPSKEKLENVSINLQAFIFNLYGCIDNLAWVWVYEKNIKGKNGNNLKNHDVGLGKRFKLVSRSFSSEFKAYLEDSEKWFEYLENYRHALAHRIPLYIPPFAVTEDNENKYRKLEKRKLDSLKSYNMELHDKLKEEQNRLRIFKPIITHSFIEKAKPLAFHAQILTDFSTIEELAFKFLEELNKSTTT